MHGREVLVFRRSMLIGKKRDDRIAEVCHNETHSFGSARSSLPMQAQARVPVPLLKSTLLGGAFPLAYLLALRVVGRLSGF